MEIAVEKNYTELIDQIGDLLVLGRQKAVQNVNTILVQTYWEIGRYIVEFEQNGNEKAEYGTALFEKLSKDLTTAYGKGFGRSNLLYMRKLYLTFQISGTLSHKLTWSHYYEILKADSDLEIGFYAKQTEKEKWSVRELKRQMKSMLFHRLALSTDKEGVLRLASEGHEIEQPEDLIKDPFVLEFLNNTNTLKVIWKSDSSQIFNNFYLNLGKAVHLLADNIV
ncbi:DUF1016 N-terminal domain-containing protein [Candidatus Sulfuricurvum sp. RIFRC-1]|uniref:DUF1016 N-terminal domain-containing protein n=1 Tax=Candidatus Sulfuricurvum sp. RIFRC-1 TaxID=1249480 RepID=UPI000323A4C2|nr:DUF1016 N-terminal domain-containing protein [Candidatus Sulfuricurvum sp. RIFRC-1]